MNYELIAKLAQMLTELGAIAYFSSCMALKLWQNRLIFQPSSVVKYTPADLALAYEEVWLPVKNQKEKLEHLHGWWIPSPFPHRGTLLYLHGNGDNIAGNLVPAQRFTQLGFSVFMFDYRGYGRSKGNFPTEEQVYQDAQIAWDYLVKHRTVPPQQITIYGHSLGGAIAIELAINNPQAAGLIVESSFTSMREIVDHRGIYRIFPVDWILTHEFDSLSKVPRLQMPLLLLHGTEDLAVPAFMSQILYEAAQEPKQLLLVPDAGHNNVGSVGEEHYKKAIKDFF